MRMYISSKEHKANQKREKQRRYRHNKATRETQLRLKERRTMKIQGSTVFYVPARKEKQRLRRATRRREYRKFIGKMALELSKKMGRERLRDNKNKTREHLLTNSSFVNKKAALQKRHKHKSRIQWHAKKHVFLGTNRQDHITKRKNNNSLICRRCKLIHLNFKAFNEDCKKGCCTPAGHCDQAQNKKPNQRKLHMFENLKAITANIRGINACGKRQTLSAKWEKEGIDAALLSEVQKNTGGMEKEGNWGKYTVFYSTGIDPKKREAREQKREQKATEIIRKRRKEKARSNLHQSANPNRSKNQQGTPTHTQNRQGNWKSTLQQRKQKKLRLRTRRGSHCHT